MGGNGLGKFLNCTSLFVWKERVKLSKILVCPVSEPRAEKGGRPKYKASLLTVQPLCPFVHELKVVTYWGSIASFTRISLFINPLKTKRRLLYLKTLRTAQ